MRSLLHSPAAARPAAPHDSAGTASPQQPQRRSTAGTGSGPGWLCCLPLRHRNTPALPQPQGPQGELPPDLLLQVVMRTADAGCPQATARKLARLRPVNQAFRDAADNVQQKKPAVQRAASERRLAHAIGEATRGWRELQERTDDTRAGKKNLSHKRAEIMARLAAVVHSLNMVIVDLGSFDPSGEVASAFQDALSGHRGSPTLEIAATVGPLLDHMTPLLDARPQWLRSLAIRTRLVHWDDIDRREAEVSQARLSKVLPQQTNLGVLKLSGLSKGQPLDLDRAGFGQAIASLPSLKSLTLAGYSVGEGWLGGTALANLLRKLPGLEDLNPCKTDWTPGAFTQVVPSLADLPGLRSLDLSRTPLGRRSEGIGTYVRHLAHVLPALANLRTLDLSFTGLGPAAIAHLADSLAGLEQLQTLTLAGNPLGPEGCSQLTASLAGVPTLQHLYLTVPPQPPRDPTGLPDPEFQRNLMDVNTLEDILHPLAKCEELHIHLQGLDKKSLSRLQSALPALHIHHEP
jgi:hypothetical protein